MFFWQIFDANIIDHACVVRLPKLEMAIDWVYVGPAKMVVDQKKLFEEGNMHDVLKNLKKFLKFWKNDM